MVFARTGATTGKSYRIVAAPEAVPASYLIRVRITNEALYPNFLELFFQSEEYWSQIKKGTSGSAQGGFNASKLSELTIEFPRLKEQKRIVAILDEAFAGIDTAIAKTEKNLANARELFESYLNSVFSQRGEEWRSCQLGDVCTLQRGFDLPKKNRAPGQVPLMSSSGAIDLHSEAKVLGPGVVTGRSGSIGSVFYVDDDFWPLNTTLYVKDFHGNYPRFVYYLLSSFKLERFSSGAGVPTLNRNSVHGEAVRVPENLEEQKRIVETLDYLGVEAQRLERIYQQKLTALAELKQSLLEKAFSGELTADAVEEVDTVEAAPA